MAIGGRQSDGFVQRVLVVALRREGVAQRRQALVKKGDGGN